MVLVLSIGSFFVFGIGVVMAIVALCLCPSAQRNIEASNGALTGEGFVTAARVMSWITIALTILVVVFFVVIFVVAAFFEGTGEFTALGAAFLA